MELTVKSVAGSASWRIPLGVQIVPGVILGLGILALPPSPRDLIAHGDEDGALAVLQRLRAGAEQPLVQVRMARPYLICLEPYH